MSCDMHVKIDEMNSDVLIADVIRKFNFRKINLLYLPILHGDLERNDAGIEVFIRNQRRKLKH